MVQQYSNYKVQQIGYNVCKFITLSSYFILNPVYISLRVSLMDYKRLVKTLRTMEVLGKHTM